MTAWSGVGLFVPNDRAHLQLIQPLLQRADFFEISPESFWRAGCRDHSGVELLSELQQQFGKPFVAHGLGYSMGTPLPPGGPEAERTAAWLRQIESFQARLQFAWYTDHLGFQATGDGRQNVLPLPLPHTRQARETVQARLRRLADIVPCVGFENSVFYFTLGEAEAEANFYNQLTADGSCRLLLDLHNVHTHCLNFGLDPRAFLERIDTRRVLEIHLSGGEESEADWLDSGQVLRLDSHDNPIPEPVWQLYELAVQRCPQLRAVALERLEGTLRPEQVEGLAAELQRARQIFEQRRQQPVASAALEPLADRDDLDAQQRELTGRLWAGEVEGDGQELTHVLLRNLRMGRLLRGLPELRQQRSDDPEAFFARLARYFEEAPPRSFFSEDEAAQFAAWTSSG